MPRSIRSSALTSAILAFVAGACAHDVDSPLPAVSAVTPDLVCNGRTVTSADIIEGVRARGHEAYAFAEREACGDKLIELARPGDRIVIMGARDDTLSTFAQDLLRRLG